MSTQLNLVSTPKLLTLSAVSAQATAAAARPVLKQGASGQAVKDLQTMLNRENHAGLKVDGQFGPGTAAAVKAYQASRGLTADGVVGQQTWNALITHKAPVNNTVPKTVQDCAKFLLNSKNVRFWTGLSTGSDRKNFERLARGEKAYVPATGRYVTPNLRLMQALVAMAKHGPVMINALTGGHHSPNSNHYRGTAVDLDLSTGNASSLVRIANQYGGRRNSETSHIHLDF